MSSRLRHAARLKKAGKWREALAAYSEELRRPIQETVDAEIVQSAYYHIGVIHKEQHELQQAVDSLGKARELFRLHRVGTAPHRTLAEVLIELNRLDEAEAVCSEWVIDYPDGLAKQVLADVLARKESGGKTG
jgi:tetratricopeptide (TPR) repeat protein